MFHAIFTERFCERVAVFVIPAGWVSMHTPVWPPGEWLSHSENRRE